MPTRIPDDRREAILADIRTGSGSCRGIARARNVSTATVRKIAKDAGVVDAFSRDRTQNATRARVADMKSDRARIAADLLADVDRLRERAWSEYVVPMSMGGKDGGITMVTLKVPPLGEVRNAYTAIGIVLDKHLRLEQHDSDTQGLSAVDAWLREMVGGE